MDKQIRPCWSEEKIDAGWDPVHVMNGIAYRSTPHGKEFSQCNDAGFYFNAAKYLN